MMLRRLTVCLRGRAEAPDVSGSSAAPAELAEVEARLEAALADNRRLELQLGSSRHSLGNHLALLSAMLARQARTASDADARDTLRTAVGRVSAIAEVMRGERMGVRELVDARGLVDRVLKVVTEPAASMGVAIEVEVGNFDLTADAALPFLVILDELMVNALKHAFPDRIGGTIHVGFGETEQSTGKEVFLVVEDDGIGAGRGVVASRFGSKIISSMIKTLDATFIQEPKSADPDRPGFRTIVKTSRR
jgi:two-component sensor histidine kinase